MHTHAKRSHTHVKDLIVHVGLRWIMETLTKRTKNQACIVSWVARLSGSWLAPGKSDPNVAPNPAFCQKSAPNVIRAVIGCNSSARNRTGPILSTRVNRQRCTVLWRGFEFEHGENSAKSCRFAVAGRVVVVYGESDTNVPWEKSQFNGTIQL